MERVALNLEEFVNFLIFKSGLNLSDLANELGVTRQTLSNWRSGKISKIDPDTITKLQEAMRRNHWGIRLGSISRSTIEIVNTTDSAKAEVKNSDSLLREDVIKYQIKYIEKLEAEILTLREQLEKYTSKSKG